MRYEVKQVGLKFKVVDYLNKVYLPENYQFYDDAFNAAMGYGNMRKHLYDELMWLLHRHAIGDDVKYELKYQVYKLGGLGGVW